MNDSNEERLKIAVFIDFDNIAIGVKQSLGRNFDVGTVLEAIKEKGQVVTKIAYGDWKRNEDFSRAMTQHAVQMVQRNLTPGGDKNGADIALALDALEMAFTRDHINAFVIVGGDSDFIALVEKLKQYDKVVFVVGGRAFTSVILQKNCHEFMSYENLIGVQSGGRRSSGRQQMLSSPAPLETALPLVRRSLKILSDREVSPQLGLLKSTLLQLDSTFSERDYGVSSFRDFMQKLANAGFVHLKQVDRSLLVELKDLSEADQNTETEASTGSNILTFQANGPSTETSPTPGLPSEATLSLQESIRESKTRPHWPLYLRSFKQFLRSLQPPFDERQFGITSTYDLVRQAQKDGLLHVERNRQGILRIYPGELLKQDIESPEEETGNKESASEAGTGEAALKTPADAKAETREPEVEAAVKKEDPSEQSSIESAGDSKPKRRRKTTKPTKPRGKTAKAKEASSAKSGNIETAPQEPATASESQKESAGDEMEKTHTTVASETVAAEPAAEPETKPPAKKPAARRKTKTSTAKTATKKTAAAKTARTRKTASKKTKANKKTKAVKPSAEETGSGEE